MSDRTEPETAPDSGVFRHLLRFNEIGKRSGTIPLGRYLWDDTALEKLGIDLDTFSRALIAFGVSLRPRFNEINARLDEIGPPPVAGEAAEPETLAKERQELLDEKARTSALLGEAENLSIRASRTTDRIGWLRRELSSDTLFKRAEIDAAIG